MVYTSGVSGLDLLGGHNFPLPNYLTVMLERLTALLEYIDLFKFLLAGHNRYLQGLCPTGPCYRYTALVYTII